MYVYEAFQNILENKRNLSVVLIFFVLGYTGIAVTDSLIYSTSQKAEMELSLNGKNVINIAFNSKVSGRIIDAIFINEPYIVSKSKKVPFYTGVSPFSNEMKMVLGTDDVNIFSRSIKISSSFANNTIIIADNAKKHLDNNVVFLNGLPFSIIGEIKNPKTDFLDSLGLSSFRDNINYIIPIETMFRLTLDDTIDAIDLVKDGEIDSNDIIRVKNKLMRNGISDFTVRSILDAKEAVGNVLNRFALLTNSVYTLLTMMMLVIIVTVCRKAFQSRCTEFALKVIHGIDKKTITNIVIIEMFLLTLASVLFSVVFTLILMRCLSLYLSMELFFRPIMIGISFFVVLFASYTVGIYSGRYFFKQNPVDLIKNRKQ